MAEVQKIRRPYELLVRWRDGVVVGAHLQYENVLIVDGEVVKRELDYDLEPIDKNALVTHAVLGEEVTVALADKALKSQEADALRARVKSAEAQVKALKEREAKTHLASMQRLQ